MASKNEMKVIIGSGIVALAIIGGTIWYVGTHSSPGTQSPTADTSGLGIQGLAVEGTSTAPATILEFGDFQCVACAQFFATTEQQIRKEFIDTGKANMVFKPLTFIDSYAGKSRSGESWHAAQAAECAADQGKFWQMHDAIYSAEVKEANTGKTNENSGNLTADFFMSAAKDMGLDTAKFSQCFNNQDHTDAIDGYEIDMGNAGVTGTPTVFILKDGKASRISSTFDISEYRRIIEGN